MWRTLALLGATAGLALGVPGQPAALAADADDACTPGTVVWMDPEPPAHALLQTDLAWTVTRGEGALVAVVDSGVDGGNAHLSDAVVSGLDLVQDGSSSLGLTDADGHGTAIAGIIAAREVPGSGVIGLAPDSRVLPIRVFVANTDEARQAGLGPTPARIAAAIRYATDQGAQVINVSLSTPDDDPDLRAAVEDATARGALVVASAGNWSTAESGADGPRYPAAYPQALAVAAVEADGSPSAASMPGPHVDVAAPGAQVLTAAAGAGDCLYAADTAQSSFATGYAAAAAALVAVAHPTESPDQWSWRLRTTASRPNPDQRDDDIGWGIVQPYDAMALVPTGDTRGPAGPSTGTIAAAQATEQEPVVLAPAERPWQPARETAVVVGVLTAPMIGVLVVVLGLRRRRRAPDPEPDPVRTGSGLAQRAPIRVARAPDRR
ncbi:type VII secretion-associated serine protease [Cellulomonas denverensis]|nr:type VII secretion-associated serine protease [Cellulomonas denverensis]